VACRKGIPITRLFPSRWLKPIDAPCLHINGTYFSGVMRRQNGEFNSPSPCGRLKNGFYIFFAGTATTRQSLDGRKKIICRAKTHPKIASL